MKIMEKFLALCAIVVIAAALSAPASAAFPGKNGRIAFIYGSGACGGFGGYGTGDLYTMNSDGSHVKRLTHFGPTFKRVVANESWSADGREIVFTEIPRSQCGGSELWIVDNDGSRRPRRLFNDQGFRDTEPSFSPDGKFVIFSHLPHNYSKNNAIYRVNVDGTGLTAITNYGLRSGDTWPEYSPRGNQIAFTTSRYGVICAIAVMKADGSNIHIVSPARLGAEAPDWAPDGRGLVFDTYQHFLAWGENEELWTVDLEGDGVTRLTKNNFRGQTSYYAQAHDYTPAWSPDGTAIVFSHWNGPLKKWGIYVMRRNGASWETTDVTPHGFAAVPQVAPPPGGARFSRSASPAALLQSGGANPRWGTAPNIAGPDLGDHP